MKSKRESSRGIILKVIRLELFLDHTVDSLETANPVTRIFHEKYSTQHARQRQRQRR